MTTIQTVCEEHFTTKDRAQISVKVRRARGRLAVSIHWPAGMDSAPSVRWFDTDSDAMAGYLVACKQIRERYAA
jgi:hypothetical protein